MREPKDRGLGFAVLVHPAVQLVRFSTKLALAAFLDPQLVGAVFLAGLCAFAAQQFAALGIDVRVAAGGTLDALRRRALRAELDLAALVLGLGLALIAGLTWSLDSSFGLALLLLAPRLFILNRASLASAELVRASRHRAMFAADVASAGALCIGTLIALLGLGVSEALLVGWWCEALTGWAIAGRAARGLRRTRTESGPPIATFSAGMKIAGSQAFAFLGERIDAMAVAFVFGPRGFGLYDLANHLATVALNYTAQFSERWYLPRARPPGGPALLLRAQLLVADWLVPLHLGLALCASDLRQALFRPAWAGIDAVLQALAIASLGRVLGVLPRLSLLAGMRTSLVLRVNMGEVVALALTVLGAIALGGDLALIAWSVAAIRCTAALVWMVLSARAGSLPRGPWLAASVRAVACAGVAAQVLAVSPDGLMGIALAGVAGLALLIGLRWSVDRTRLLEEWCFVRGMRLQRGAQERNR